MTSAGGAAALVGVDWGTTSLRLWALGPDGGVLAERSSRQGMSTLAPADYDGVLARLLDQMAIGADVPVVVCGMAGAAQGWLNAPYIDLPADVTEIARAAVAAPAPGRDVRVLPGVAKRDAAAPDVMRGEETMLLGARLERAVDGWVCLPGTHSKWARLAGDRLADFRTAMTGEVFALLAERSTLAAFAGEERGVVEASPAFAQAVAEALAAPEALLATLFSARAGPLLFGDAHAAAARARLSGLLIGAEVAALAPAGEAVTLIAAGPLAAAYRRAFQIRGVAFAELDAAPAVRAGLFHAGRMLWPDRFAGADDAV